MISLIKPFELEKRDSILSYRSISTCVPIGSTLRCLLFEYSIANITNDFFDIENVNNTWRKNITKKKCTKVDQNWECAEFEESMLEFASDDVRIIAVLVSQLQRRLELKFSVRNYMQCWLIDFQQRLVWFSCKNVCDFVGFYSFHGSKPYFICCKAQLNPIITPFQPVICFIRWIFASMAKPRKETKKKPWMNTNSQKFIVFVVICSEKLVPLVISLIWVALQQK